jgi:hypothetical protein
MARKQKDLPGIDEVPEIAAARIKAVDEAAADYVKERDRRCRQTPREVATKQKLIDELTKRP